MFLQVLVFKDIVTQGYFMGVEGNLTILYFEVGLTVFSAVYLLHLFVSKLRSIH